MSAESNTPPNESLVASELAGKDFSNLYGIIDKGKLIST